MRFCSAKALAIPLYLAMALGANGCQSTSSEKLIQSSNWPKVTPILAKDPVLEAKIATLVAQLSLEQKVGQMIQAEISGVSVDEIKQYRIGSVLNGGGQTPNNNTQATAQDWVDFAEKLFQASMTPAPGIIPIPIFWGVDAVHGHGNVRGATLYPHNIALGATRNGDLVKAIGAATAQEIVATGLDWDFAPTVAVARNDSWGRIYESYSEDPALVAELGAKAIEGLQGTPNTGQFLDAQHVLATAKHFIGDGGTEHGDDQGFTVGDEEELLRLHLPGYTRAVASGVQTVMASYSWWNGTHSHANKRLMTDLLKNHLGFDGLIVSDWQAIGYVPGCTIDNCAEAVNAGVDLFMVPNAPEWKNFYHNTLAQVKNGAIPISRIDDAVTRILRVKMRLGLWQKPSPAQRVFAGKQNLIGNADHRALARQAVRESMVLLKNNGVLPIDPRKTILITGSGAENLSMQVGGWSVTWQGDDTKNSDFPGATSIYKGLQNAIIEAGGNALRQTDINSSTRIDAAIVVFGEKAYAEMNGDLQNLATLEVEQHHKTTLKQIQALKARGIPVVAVLLSGRPLWVNKELNVADAFVAAWQPGTEGMGVADVLLRNQVGQVQYDFTGKLSFSWPATPCDTQVNIGDIDYAPLFPFGYGLNYGSKNLYTHQSEVTSPWQFGCLIGSTLPAAQTQAFLPSDGWHYFAERKSLAKSLIQNTTQIGAITASANNDRGYGFDARWDGSEMGRVTLRNNQLRNDFLSLLANDGAIILDIRMQEKPTALTEITLFSGLSAYNSVNIQTRLNEMTPNRWQSLSIDLSCFSQRRIDMSKLEIPFAVQSEGKLALSIANVRYEPNRGVSADISCKE